MIDETKLIAEIERIMAEEMEAYKVSCKEGDAEHSGSPMVYTRLQMLLSFINSLTECQQVSPVDGDELEKEVERLYSIYHFNAPIGETRFIAKHFANWKIEKALGIADKAYFESCARFRQHTIDKACKWIKCLNNTHHIMSYKTSCEASLDELTEWFKNYMEE